MHEKQSKGLSWTSAMDEVRVRRLIQKYSDDGELDREDPALMMLKEWPSSQLYIDNPENLPGLEQLVCIIGKNDLHSDVKTKPQIFYFLSFVLRRCIL